MQRQTIFVTKNIVGGAKSFQYTISNVFFEPDEVIVKTFHFTDSGGGTITLPLIYSDLIGNNPMIAFANLVGGTINLLLNAYFPLKKSVNGTYTFSFLNQAGNQLTLDGIIGFQLEFIKYK